MKKLKWFGFVACCLLAGLFMTSCGSREKIVEASNSDVCDSSLDCVEYLSVVEGNYTLTNEGTKGLSIDVKFKLNKKFPSKIASIDGPNVYFCDSAYYSVFKPEKTKLSLDKSSRSKLKTFLTKNDVGDEIILNFYNDSVGEENVNNALKKAAKLFVGDCNIQAADETKEESAELSKKNIKADKSIDDLLDQFEKAINKLEKEVSNNDGGLLGDALNMTNSLDKIQKIEDKIEKKQDKMTDDQKKRYLELTGKLSSVAIGSLF